MNMQGEELDRARKKAEAVSGILMRQCFSAVSSAGGMKTQGRELEPARKKAETARSVLTWQ